MSDAGETEDEVLAYHELFEDARKVLRDSEANQRRSQSVREELEAYIDSASELKGTDGQPLIRVPSNFDTIVNSMNRDDLSVLASDEKPWSQYLLLDGLNATDDTEYNGRYNHAFHDTAEGKIKRGLAQIQLLDRQLQEATLKTILKPPRTNESEVDETFITTTQSRKGPTRIVHSTRSTTNKLDQEKVSGVHDAGKERDRKRLDRLLSEDLDGDYWDPLLDAERKVVDQKLAEFGRMGLLELNADLIEPLAVSARTERRPDYLDELRSARMEKERSERLDQLISECSNHPILYEALLPTAFTTMNNNEAGSVGGRSISSGRKDETVSTYGGRLSTISGRVGDIPVPDPGTVRPDKPVTFEDIKQLLFMLGGPDVQDDGFSVSAMTSRSKSPLRYSNMTRSDSPAQSLQLCTVDKEGIKALVRQYKHDIEALGRVRAGHSLPVSATVDSVPHLEKSVDESTANETVRFDGSKSPKRRTTSRAAVINEGPWLDASEEVPVAAINIVHPAVLATGSRAVGYSIKKETTNQLPPIPPVLMRDANQNDQVKHPSALVVERDDSINPTSSSPAPASQHESSTRHSDLGYEKTARSPKTLRLPTSVLNAQLPSSRSINTTIFRAVNARLESEATAALNVKIANGARLAKKIGATLASNHHRPNSRHTYQGQGDTEEQQQMSPQSARRALKAQNVLSSVPTAIKPQSDSMRI